MVGAPSGSTWVQVIGQATESSEREGAASPETADRYHSQRDTKLSFHPEGQHLPQPLLWHCLGQKTPEHTSAPPQSRSCKSPARVTLRRHTLPIPHLSKACKRHPLGQHSPRH